MSLNFLPEIKVIWVDSSTHGEEWVSLEDAKSISTKPCQTVGFLLSEDSETIKVAQNIAEDCILNRIAIPRGCIKEIYEKPIWTKRGSINDGDRQDFSWLDRH